MKKYGMKKAPVFLEAGDVCETSPYGEKRGNYIHRGVDVVRNVGYNTTATIVAIADGKVTAVKNTVTGVTKAHPEGNYVDIDHGGGMVSRYFHLKHGSIPASVRVGAAVKKGTVLGFMGNTGDSQGAHLHFQLEQNGKPIDGAPYLKGQKVIGGAVANIPAEEYIKKIVAKVGYDDPAAAIAAFKKAQHPFPADLWRKLWEALR